MVVDPSQGRTLTPRGGILQGQVRTPLFAGAIAKIVKSLLDNKGCVCRKPKFGRSDDEVRRVSRVISWFRSAGPGERPAHLYPMTGAS